MSHYPDQIEKLAAGTSVTSAYIGSVSNVIFEEYGVYLQWTAWIVSIAAAYYTYWRGRRAEQRASARERREIELHQIRMHNERQKGARESGSNHSGEGTWVPD